MIAAIQDALLAHIQSLLAKKVLYVESHPGNWSEATVRTIVNAAPAVYVAWLGASKANTPGVITNKWAVYVVAKTLNAKVEEPVGAYQMAERIMASFDGMQVQGVGTMNLDRAENLWSDARAGNGVIIYALYYLNPGRLEPLTIESELDDFLRHYQDFSQPSDDGKDGAPLMQAHIHLPGTGENNEET
ncbi:DUF1834 family protein [Salmonella enterica]|nr:DUF1834 family protein [Salmonella enterica]EHH5781165.1 DUF1834 family protein [Salmonella enterica]ELE3234343.1 DUF1834 family protein [Salmonella enterica subsp. enterica serovar Pomona]ELZ0794990.1 DUF1834 family protein [Salmonella enterica]